MKSYPTQYGRMICSYLVYKLNKVLSSILEELILEIWLIPSLVGSKFELHEIVSSNLHSFGHNMLNKNCVTEWNITGPLSPTMCIINGTNLFTSSVAGSPLGFNIYTFDAYNDTFKADPSLVTITFTPPLGNNPYVISSNTLGVLQVNFSICKAWPTPYLMRVFSKPSRKSFLNYHYTRFFFFFFLSFFFCFLLGPPPRI
jgi:hypothetical protein